MRAVAFRFSRGMLYGRRWRRDTRSCSPVRKTPNPRSGLTAHHASL